MHIDRFVQGGGIRDLVQNLALGKLVQLRHTGLLVHPAALKTPGVEHGLKGRFLDVHSTRAGIRYIFLGHV